MRRILAADIGGTNCRFADFILEDERLSLVRCAWISSDGLTDTDMTLAALMRELETPLDNADVLVFALAGPVSKGLCAKLTNGFLNIDFTDITQRYGITRALIINDFVAQAYACVTEAGQKARCVVKPLKRTRALGRCGVIGAGTGLGMASLVYDEYRGTVTPAPSEGGHANFPFIGDEEYAFQAFVCKELNCNFARAEDVLSGRGLSLLHRYLTGERLSAREVGKKALCGDTRTLRWFSRFYARVCRNWILSTLCTDGLWIAGGIAAGDSLTVTSEYFLQELYAVSHKEALIRSVPVYLIEDKNSGLWGAAHAGLELLRAENAIT